MPGKTVGAKVRVCACVREGERLCMVFVVCLLCTSELMFLLIKLQRASRSRREVEARLHSH